MFSLRVFIAVLALSAAAVAFDATTTAADPFPETYYGYINQSVEYGSAFFYAIRGDANATKRQTAPLILFLQGGPGATSLFSDYLETGPEKLIINNSNPQGFSLVKREHTWTKHATMLYVDNPIGTGFSYTRDPRGFSTTDREIADNLVNFLGKFLAKHSEFQPRDFWIFCESYGGKMTAYFGAALAKAIAAKIITVNFKGVEIGDGWVDPIDCMYSYGPYLQTFSQVSPAQADNITQYAEFAQNALEEGNGTAATNWWSNQQNLIGLATGGINWYNSLYYYDYTADNQLDQFLGSNFTTTLGALVPPGVYYNSQSGDVFNYMGNDFMNDGISQVDEILAAGYEVNILTGQVDLIVDVVCMQSWVKKLMWPELPAFWQQPRLAVTVPGALNVGGFVQRYKNLRIWQVNLAGHMVPLDNPPVAEMMVATIVGDSVSDIKVTETSYEPKHPSGKPVVHMTRNTRN